MFFKLTYYGNDDYKMVIGYDGIENKISNWNFLSKHHLETCSFVFICRKIGICEGGKCLYKVKGTNFQLNRQRFHLRNFHLQNFHLMIPSILPVFSTFSSIFTNSRGMLITTRFFIRLELCFWYISRAVPQQTIRHKIYAHARNHMILIFLISLFEKDV